MYEDSRPRTDVELHQVVNDLNQPQLPVKKSPWQLIIIPTAMESAQSSYTMMLRGHHSLGDGISHMRLMIEHLFDKSDDNHERPLPRGRYGPTKSIWTLLGAIFYGPYVAVAQLLRHADRNELHGPEMTGVKVMAWSPPINLASVKQVKNACGATVNDVLTACLTGAFRDTFMDRRAEIPDNIYATIPVNLRPASAPLVMDNEFSLVTLQLPTFEPDDLQRLYEVKHRMEAIKQSPEHLITAAMINYTLNRYPNFLSKPLFDFITRKYSLVLSNVPGPQETMKIFGREVRMMTFWPPGRSNVAFGASIISYRGEVRVGVRCDTAVLDNPAFVCDRFLKHFGHLVEQAKAMA